MAISLLHKIISCFSKEHDNWGTLAVSLQKVIDKECPVSNYIGQVQGITWNDYFNLRRATGLQSGPFQGMILFKEMLSYFHKSLITGKKKRGERVSFMDQKI